ncbi:MAG: hypothetical protein ACKODX_17885, partial [Gemmata sp.]
MIRTPLLALAALALSGPGARAAPPDVADLFPADTLVYAELHGPAELGPQLAALFKGTLLEDDIPLVHGKKDGAKTLGELKGHHDLARLALLLSPEVLSEFRKLGGVALGLTGFNAQGRPELALAALTGDSAAAGLAARAFVTATPTLRRVGEVSAVPVFQHRAPVVQYDPIGAPKLGAEKPKEGAYEFTAAYTPGLFVVGTSRAALAPVVARFKGEAKGGLTAADGFKAAAAEYRKPGLFFYADAAAYFAKDAAAAPLRAATGGGSEPDPLAWLKLTCNPKALRAVAGGARLRADGLELTVGLKLDPAQKSPLGDFLGAAGAKADALHHARKPAALAATVGLPAKDRGAAALALLDALAKCGGELGRLPGDLVKDIDARYKSSVKDEALAKVRAVTVIVPSKQDLPKGATPLPVLVCHAEDAAAATALEAFVPRLVAEIAGDKEPAQPSSETIDGVKVYSLAGTGLPWAAATHFARKGAVLVVGLDRKLVAAAVTPDAANSVAGDKGPPLPPDAPLVGAFSLGEVLTAFEPQPAGGAGPVKPVEPPRP